MPPKGRKAPRADVDKMRDQLAVYSEENTLKKIEERIDGNPEYIPKAIEVLQMLEAQSPGPQLTGFNPLNKGAELLQHCIGGPTGRSQRV